MKLREKISIARLTPFLFFLSTLLSCSEQRFAFRDKTKVRLQESPVTVAVEKKSTSILPVNLTTQQFEEALASSDDAKVSIIPLTHSFQSRSMQSNKLKGVNDKHTGITGEKLAKENKPGTAHARSPEARIVGWILLGLVVILVSILALLLIFKLVGLMFSGIS